MELSSVARCRSSKRRPVGCDGTHGDCGRWGGGAVSALTPEADTQYFPVLLLWILLFRIFFVIFQI